MLIVCGCGHSGWKTYNRYYLSRREEPPGGDYQEAIEIGCEACGQALELIVADNETVGEIEQGREKG